MEDASRLLAQERAIARFERAIPPVDVALEKLALGQVLGSKAGADLILGSLRAGDFFNQSHRELFEGLRRIWAGQQPDADGERTGLLARARALGIGKATAAKAEHAQDLCAGLRRLARRRLILDESRKLYLAGHEEDWPARAAGVLALIEALPALVGASAGTEQEDVLHTRGKHDYGKKTRGP